MRRNRWLTSLAFAGTGVVVISSAALAQEASVEGTYSLKGEQGFLVANKLESKFATDVKLTVTKNPDGTVKVLREITYRDGKAAEIWDGSGYVKNGRIYARFTLRSGISDVV